MSRREAIFPQDVFINVAVVFSYLTVNPRHHTEGRDERKTREYLCVEEQELDIFIKSNNFSDRSLHRFSRVNELIRVVAKNSKNRNWKKTNDFSIYKPIPTVKKRIPHLCNSGAVHVKSLYDPVSLKNN